jgi:O-antigen ligase
MTIFVFILLHMQDIVAVLAPVSLALLAVAHVRQFSIPHRLPHEILFTFLFLAFVGFNIALHGSLTGIETIQFFRAHGKIFYTLSMFVLFFCLRPGANIESPVYHGAIFAAAIVSFISLYSYFVSPIQIGGSALESHKLMRGPLGGHTVTAGSMGLALIYFLATMSEKKAAQALFPRRYKLLVLGATGITAVAFVVAQSRGFALALLAVVGLMALVQLATDLSRKKLSHSALRYLLAMIVAAVAILAVLASRLTGMEDDPNVTTRLDLWERALRMFSQSPVIGLGLGTFQQTNIVVQELVPGLLGIKTSGVYLEEVIHHNVEGGMHAHNVFLQILSELGLFGLILFFIPFLIGMRRRIPAPTQTSTPEMDRLRHAARFNQKLLVYFFVYLAVGGLAGGQTFTSPTLAWPIYIALARLARQHMQLMHLQKASLKNDAAPG